jgi:glycolate oxidase iron-sulfur subunit
MGERWSNLARMAPIRLPAAQEYGRAGTYPGVGSERRRVALLTDCAQPVLAPAIDAATIRVLNRSGCDVIVPARGGCCGALSLHMGLERSAVDFARRNVDAWRVELEGEGLHAVAVNASGCGTMVKDYAHLLWNDAIRVEPSRRRAA